MKRFTLISTALLALFAFSCATTATEVEENLTPGEFFQKGQEATTNFQNYEQALVYYKTFIERYPEQQALIVEAEYEIAFLYYKMGNNAVASDLFSRLLDKYERPEAAILPAWPKVMSEKILEIINNSETEEAEETETAE